MTLITVDFIAQCVHDTDVFIALCAVAVAVSAAAVIFWLQFSVIIGSFCVPMLTVVVCLCHTVWLLELLVSFAYRCVCVCSLCMMCASAVVW